MNRKELLEELPKYGHDLSEIQFYSKSTVDQFAISELMRLRKHICNLVNTNLRDLKDEISLLINELDDLQETLEDSPNPQSTLIVSISTIYFNDEIGKVIAIRLEK